MSPDVYAYLGIELNMKGSQVELLQTGLTNKVLAATRMSECNPNWTPAIETPLTADVDGEEFNESWEYASVVGMLMYLVNTRPDIQFAVHQCAKYTHNPKACHAEAVKKVCRYLQGTKARGMCFNRKPIREKLRMDCYVDASFTPLFGYEQSDNPKSAESRTGYVIYIDDVPISWCSKGQGMVALSTTEAEYIALSMAMRELIWLRRLVDDISKGFDIGYDGITKIYSKVYEDNQGALALVKKPHATSRTRHLNTKYHHFKEHVGVKDGVGIELEYIETENQIADMLTKGLGHDLFEKLRDKLMNWNTTEQNTSTETSDSQEGSKIDSAREGVLGNAMVTSCRCEPCEQENEMHKRAMTAKVKAGSPRRRRRRRGHKFTTEQDKNDKK